MEGEFLVGVAHFDWAHEAEVGEGVDDGDFLIRGAGALVGVEGEFEGAGKIGGPEGGGGGFHGGVDRGEVGAVAPELVDGHCEDGAAD